MGLKRRILGFFTFFFITIFSAHAMAASYSCDEKQYDSCKSGYYMTVDGVYNGTPQVGNACTLCNTTVAKYCPGGTFAPMYAVTLNANGGTAGNITTIYRTQGNGWYYNTTDTSIGTKITTLTSAQLPTRPGYTFNGFTTSTGTQIIKNDGTIVSGYDSGMGTIIYAQWTLNTYTIKYDANGGTGTMSNTTCTYGSDCTLRTNAFTKTGYTFAGWTYNGTSYSNGQSVSNLTPTNGATLTFTAKWTANTYTIKYDANGGSGTMSNTTCAYGSDCALRTNTFTKTGYTFAGWTYDGTTYSNGQSVSNLTSTNGATLTFTAQWTANTYTIKYDANGGTGTMSDTTCTYGSDCTLRTNAFTRTGYTFAGWTYNGTSYYNGRTVSNLTSTNGAILTFTAQWTANTYKLTLDGNGANYNIQPCTNLDQGVVYYTYDTNVFACTIIDTKNAIEPHIRNGYELNGYYTSASGGTKVINADGTLVAKNLITSDTTLYAQWTANTYTIKYDKNSGTGTMSDTTCTYGSDCTLRTNTFTKTGYTFAGWTYNGTSYSNGATVKNLSSTNGATLTFTAQWTVNTYTLTLDRNDATSGDTTATIQYGASGFCSAGSKTDTTCSLNIYTPYRTGYTFNGYFTEQTGGTMWIDNNGYPVSSTMITSSRTLYAQYTANKYNCPAGEYLSGTSCMTCTAGSYCPGVTDQEYTGGDIGVITCPENSSSESGASVCTCNDGFINNGGTTTTTNACVSDYKFFMTTTPDTTEFSFDISAAGTFYIDWGDGNTKTIEKTRTGRQKISHTYATANEYVIKLGGKATEYIYKSYSDGYGSGDSMISFYNNLNLGKIDGSLGMIFSTLSDDSQPTFQSTFSGCLNLTGSIPENLFAGISGAPADAMFGSTFYGCSNLSGPIPQGLFGNLTGEPASFMFHNTFNGCSNLSGPIPQGLFGNLTGSPARFMFSGTFYGCSNLSGPIPQGLFGNLTEEPARDMFSSTFNGCSNLSGPIPQGLFGNLTGSPAEGMFSYTFSGCSNLSGPIPQGLFGNLTGNPAYYMFGSTFEGCSSLSGSIPEGLFGNLTGEPATWMFYNTFRGCSNLSGPIPQGLFGNLTGNPAYYMFAYTFYGCSNLSGPIPQGLFGNLTGKPAQSMFFNTFSGCSNLESFIPPTLFSGIDTPDIATATYQMSSIFYDSGIVTQCPVGYYQYMTGFEEYFDSRVSCTPCPAGYTNAGPGLTSESQCVMTVEPGYYIKNPGETTPTQCPAGSYCAGGDVPYGSTGPINACPAMTNPYGAVYTNTVDESNDLNENGVYDSIDECVGEYTFAHKSFMGAIDKEHVSDSPANERGMYNVTCHYNPTSGHYDIDCLGSGMLYGCSTGYYFTNVDKIDWNDTINQDKNEYFVKTNTLEQAIEQICIPANVDYLSPGAEGCFEQYSSSEEQVACVLSKTQHCTTLDEQCALKTFWSQHPCPENSSTRGLTGQEYCVCDDGYTVDGTANGATTTMYDACIRAEVTITYDVNGASGAVASQTCPIGKPCDLKTPEQVGHDMYRAGYVFRGWALDKNGGSCYSSNGDVWVCGIGYQYTFDKDTTVYAVWIPCANGTYKTADANAGEQCSACPTITNTYGAYLTNVVTEDFNNNGNTDSIDECVGDYIFAEKYFATTQGDNGYDPDAPANKRGVYGTKCRYNPTTNAYDMNCYGFPSYYGCASGYYFPNTYLWDITEEDADVPYIKTDTLAQAIEQICKSTDIDHWSPGVQDCYDKYTSNDDINACLLPKVKQCNLTMDDVYNDLTDEQLYCLINVFYDQHPCPENSSTRGLTGQEYCVCDDGYTVDGTANGATTTMYDACIKAEIILTYDVNGASGAVAQQTCPADSPCDIKTPSQIGHDMYRPGYVFNGWALNENDTTPIDYQYTFNENTTVYAIWTPCANGTYKTADANAGEQCSACSDLGTEYTFSDIASTSASQCRAECMEYSVVYGTAIPLEQYKFWPNKCAYRGESITGNPCDIIDGVCVEKSCNYDYEMINGRCQACNREHALTYKPTGNCVVATCGYGYHADGQYCVGDTKECSAPNAISAHQVWDTNKNAFSECLITECESGYHVSENVCQLDDQTCELEHGFGEREWDDQTNSWGKCVATYCEPGYTNDPDQTNESWEQCGRCNNMYTTDGIMAVSSYVQGCEIASCMNQGEQFILDGNECRLICDEYSDETGRRYWDGKKCVHECAGGYTQW